MQSARLCHYVIITVNQDDREEANLVQDYVSPAVLMKTPALTISSVFSNCMKRSQVRTLTTSLMTSY